MLLRYAPRAHTARRAGVESVTCFADQGGMPANPRIIAVINIDIGLNAVKMLWDGGLILVPRTRRAIRHQTMCEAVTGKIDGRVHKVGL